MSVDVEALARRVYELHRVCDVRRGRARTPVPQWSELSAGRRAELVAAYARVHATYYAGRRDAREVRIG